MLNKLGQLRDLFISNLFGMTKSECLLPIEIPNLEYLYLDSVPHEYASAMRSRWRSEAANGTSVSITKARKPEWVQENLENPLRDWDGREHINSGRFKKVVAQFKKARSEVFEALSAEPDETTLGRLEDVGRTYASAFNRLDGRSPSLRQRSARNCSPRLPALWMSSNWSWVVLLRPSGLPFCRE